MKQGWIVGKGPSLEFLTREHFGDGPVIALNQSIIKVEELGLPNYVYSLQKDGGNRRVNMGSVTDPSCNYKDECGAACGDLVRPISAHLVVHEGESRWCFHDYSPRTVLNMKRLDIHRNVCSVALAAQFARHLGCDHINFLCFDAHVTSDTRTYIPGRGIIGSDESYRGQHGDLGMFLGGITHKYIRPGGK